MTTIAAFDIGSTNFRSVLGTPAGEFLSPVRTRSTSADTLVDDVAEAVERHEAATGETVDAIAVATTGAVDRDAGVVHFDTATGTETVRIPVERELHEAFDVPVRVENDCNAAALGEATFGAGADYRCVVNVTFGTGIGGGVCFDGRIFRGETGAAGEIGVIPLDALAEDDSFGVRGAWEAYSSGRGIPAYVSRRLDSEERETTLTEATSLSAKDVFDAADAGDEVARDYLRTIGRYNAAGVGAVVNAYDPGIVTVSGTVATENPDRVLGPIREHVAEYSLVDPPAIELSPIADHIGLYGALALTTSD